MAIFQVHSKALPSAACRRNCRLAEFSPGFLTTAPPFYSLEILSYEGNLEFIRKKSRRYQVISDTLARQPTLQFRSTHGAADPRQFFSCLK